MARLANAEVKLVKVPEWFRLYCFRPLLPSLVLVQSFPSVDFKVAMESFGFKQTDVASSAQIIAKEGDHRFDAGDDLRQRLCVLSCHNRNYPSHVTHAERAGVNFKNSST